MSGNTYKMKKYAAFFSGAFRSQSVYRLATVMRLFGSIIVLLVQFSLWKTLIGSGVRAGTTLNQMIAYVMITELLRTLTGGEFANELGVSIRDGSVIMHFLRPVSFDLYLLSSMLGKNWYQTLTTALPVLIVSCLIIGLPLPPSVPCFLIFLCLTLLGILIMFQLVYIAGLLAFWTQATWYLSWYVRAGVTFFGGTAIPLWFYPAALQNLSRFLPFRYISFEAINYYLGKAPVDGAAFSLGMSALWWFLLYGIGHLLWMRVQQKMTINGG
jgi:ABC-2 type transport system permease protein